MAGQAKESRDICLTQSNRKPDQDRQKEDDSVKVNFPPLKLPNDAINKKLDFWYESWEMKELSRQRDNFSSLDPVPDWS